MKYFFTESPGAQSIPEFVAVAIVDDIQIGDSNSVREATPKKDWIKFFEDHPQHLEWYNLQSNESHHFFKGTIETLRQRLNQTEGMDLLNFILLKRFALNRFLIFILKNFFAFELLICGRGAVSGISCANILLVYHSYSYCLSFQVFIFCKG